MQTVSLPITVFFFCFLQMQKSKLFYVCLADVDVAFFLHSHWSSIISLYWILAIQIWGSDWSRNWVKPSQRGNEIENIDSYWETHWHWEKKHNCTFSIMQTKKQVACRCDAGSNLLQISRTISWMQLRSLCVPMWYCDCCASRKVKYFAQIITTYQNMQMQKKIDHFN